MYFFIINPITIANTKIVVTTNVLLTTIVSSCSKDWAFICKIILYNLKIKLFQRQTETNLDLSILSHVLTKSDTRKSLISLSPYIN